ncbi:hypothetical protein [Lentiprolixibacter aurantiacus]|uniref:Uncharacterized protein n=1 Tax=Lentiprolixibacter aurantiacus TaxID=2993939 RepID=A0AAE3MK63_9FLAO|nr:hypothetical protein [Lentiprolixibacter aurantiacus]MCX2718918.1 hypothetical protein [Lentiprolixibacter aurantiacus]
MKYKCPRYTGEPSNRKFLGFDFYIQSNEKLSKKNREKLLVDSEIHMGEVIDGLNLDESSIHSTGLVQELDPNFSDYELLNIWNPIYEDFGYLMTEFKEKWEESKLKRFKNQSFKLSNEFEDLKSRVSNLQKEVMKLKGNKIKRLLG